MLLKVVSCDIHSRWASLCFAVGLCCMYMICLILRYLEISLRGRKLSCAIPRCSQLHCYFFQDHTELGMWAERGKSRLLRNEKLPICWLPGKAGIAGNKSVDADEQRPRRGDTSALKALPELLRKGRGAKQLPLNKSALTQQHAQKLR